MTPRNGLLGVGSAFSEAVQNLVTLALEACTQTLRARTHFVPTDTATAELLKNFKEVLPNLIFCR